MSDDAHLRFTKFFAETRQGLLGYVRRLTGSREAAEDVVQEAYAKTFEQGDNVREPKAFLFATARNLTLNVQRRERTAATETMGDFDDLRVVDSESASPEEAVIADEAALLLRQAIERLPPQCRAAFAKKVLHACSYKDIAAELGISPKTVEKHIARGLRETHAFLRRRYQLQDRDSGREDD